MKEVLRQTAEFERRATELLNGDLDDVDDATLRDLDEVRSFLVVVYSYRYT